MQRPLNWVAFILLTVFFGLALAILDIHLSDSVATLYLGYFLCGAILGFMRPVRDLFAAGSLAVCLYLVHLWAIAHGYKQPYVEADTANALASLVVLIPAELGALIGMEMNRILHKT